MGLCSELFEMLAPLEERTRPLTTAARNALAASKGQDALEPWNLSYELSGAPLPDSAGCRRLPRRSEPGMLAPAACAKPVWALGKGSCTKENRHSRWSRVSDIALGHWASCERAQHPNWRRRSQGCALGE